MCPFSSQLAFGYSHILRVQSRLTCVLRMFKLICLDCLLFAFLSMSDSSRGTRTLPSVWSSLHSLLLDVIVLSISINFYDSSSIIYKTHEQKSELYSLFCAFWRSFFPMLGESFLLSLALCLVNFHCLTLKGESTGHRLFQFSFI